MYVAVPVLTDAVVKGLRVKVQRTSQRQPPAVLFILVVLPESYFVCIVPKVVAHGMVVGMEAVKVRFYTVQACMRNHTVVQLESSYQEAVVRVEVCHDVVRCHVLPVGCGRAFQQ